LIDLRPCQHDDGYMDGRSQIKVHTNERTQVHSAQSSLVVTHPSTNRGRRYLTSVTESPNKHWSPLRTFNKLHQVTNTEPHKTTTKYTETNEILHNWKEEPAEGIRMI